MSDNFKIAGIGFMIGLFVAAIAAHICYDTGFNHGFAEAESRQAAAVKIAQNEVKKDYEKRIQELSASLERLHFDNAKRLRQLDDFNNTRTSLAACRRDRSRLSRLAVRGEELLRRADSYFEALKY